MKILKTVYKLIAFSLIVVLFSCTKEEEPIKLAEVNVQEFDSGYLIIKLDTDPVYLDSIYYTNNTQGTSFKIEKTEFSGYNSNSNPITSVFKPLINGNDSDIVQCCFYVNSPMSVGVSFEDLSLTLDSNYLEAIDSLYTGGNPVFCITGKY
tara:strand:- start:8539 stop:8991 length:453 start_codon:yes stop_codon:yes gene_type:complete